MSLQLILRIAGIVALVLAALFAVLAVHYYLTQDIRAVMDDLSGKARARGVAGVRKSAVSGAEAGAARGARQASAPAPAARQGTVEPAPQAGDQAFAAFAAPLDDEDGSGTVLVAAAFGSGAPAPGPDEDDLATEVASNDTGDAAAPAASGVHATEEAETGSAVFRMTRSVVMIHSQEVIAAGREL